MEIDLSKMSAKELDKLILEATEHRIKSQVPHEPEPKAKVNATYDPSWRAVLTEHNMLLLHFCKPGCGWLSFALPSNELRNLHQILTKMLPVSAGIQTASGSKH
jgi:hypothetical protein